MSYLEHELKAALKAAEDGGSNKIRLSTLSAYRMLEIIQNERLARAANRAPAGVEGSDNSQTPWGQRVLAD